MAAKDETTNSKRPILLVGSGRRPREIGAVLGALAAVRAENGEAVEPLRPHGLGDLEELLSRGPGDGTLILEYGRVPGEDIGFVRRFLERHPSWRLLVVGDDPQVAGDRGLLELPRTHWLPWPPDLEALGALLPPAPASEEEKRKPRRRPKPPATRDPEPAPRPQPAGGADLEVGGLLEELLAGAALAGEGSPRYLFRCDEPVTLDWDRAALSEVLLGLLGLARRCAGPDGVVSAQVDRAPDDRSAPGVLVRIDFPMGPLAEADLEAVLAEDFAGDPELVGDVTAARAAAEELRRRGGEAHLAPHQQGRLRIELLLPERPTPSGKAGSPPAPDRGSPEDPFA